MTNKKIIYKPIDPEMEALAQHHGGTREATLEVLKDLSAENRLNPATITEAARALHLPAHQAYGMATFYSMLSLEERGRVLRVCDGPVCWLKRSTVDGPQRGYYGRKTVDDWKEKAASGWTVERSSCLGLCDRAPAALVGRGRHAPAPEGAPRDRAGPQQAGAAGVG